MRRIGHLSSVVFLTLVIVTFAAPAFAQTIRTYGDSDSSGNTEGAAQSSSGNTGSGQAWYPGMPTPADSSDSEQSNDEEQQADARDNGDEGEGKGDEAATPSSRVTLFSGDNNTPDSPRTSLDLAIDQLYRGVIPGTRDEVAHLSRARQDGANETKTNQLTWLGFRPTDSETRVFFQTARKADYHIRRKQDPALIEIVVENTALSTQNFSRFIDTSFFNRNIEQVEAQRVDPTTVEITIELETFEQPTVRQSGNYVYLDFPYAEADDSDKQDQDTVAGQSEE